MNGKNGIRNIWPPSNEWMNNGCVTCSRIHKETERKALAEVTFSEVSASDYDAIAVIGGSGTNDHLWGNQELQSFLKQAHEQKVLVTGICAGSVTVAKTGLLSGRKAACYPVDVQIDELKANSAEYVKRHVVAHGDIITGDGPDGAKEFGESLAAALR